MKSVLVTGGTGYLGSWISRHLSECGYSVFAFCRSIPPNFAEKLPKVTLIKGDLTNTDCLERLFSHSFDAIVHTVSLDHRQSENGDINFVNAVNVNPTWNLLDRFSKKTEKFIYLSTQQVVGGPPSRVVNEDSPCRPTNTYGLTHSLGEQLCSFYDLNSPMECISLRLANGYGAPLFDSSNWNWLVINDLTSMAYSQSKLVLHSDGSPVKDFIHVDDIARATEHFLIKSTDFTTYNVASGFSVSLLEVAHLISDVFYSRFGKRVPVYHSGSTRSVGVPTYKDRKSIVDNARLLATGFSFMTSISEGINNLIDYLESRRDEA